MQRRKFITGLPFIFMAPSLLSACGEDDNTTAQGKNVIVIGAGIAGLAAAKKLQSKGFAVTVLEAQDKVGGRLRTNRSLGIAFDEGASWIHGINGNPITTLAKESGMTTAFTNDESIIAYDIGGKLINDAAYSKAEDNFYDILETMYKKGEANKSFETVFNSLYPNQSQDRLWRFFLSSFVTFDTGDLDKLSSTLYFEGEEFGGVEHIATNGYNIIPVYLANGLDVKLNQRVTNIDYTNAKVKVTHNGNESEADYVLVTVPLGVLKANKISFSPNLPTTKQTAIQKIGMNCVNKFLLTWDSAFWDDEQYLVYTAEEKDKFNYFVNVKKYNPNANALMTFAYAEYGRKTETMSDDQVITEIMKHLKDMYGSNIPNPKNMLRTKWQSNENSFGAYSYTAIGTEMRHFDDLAQDLNKKVFFAGEHTNRDYFSTAHGAYLSGIREADKIIDL
jgi:monoamine oxidase